jgi:D-alanyl-D-alanine carboxypeptidase
MFRSHFTLAILTSLVLVFGVAVSTAGAGTQSASVRKAELQRALDQVVASGVPGAIVLLREGNKTIRVMNGYADVAKKTKIRSTDRFRVGSLTKTYVSTVVLQLVGEGKLSLDDSVERWLPGVVPNGANISIRQLLNMTSGLFDYVDPRDTTILDRFQSGNLTYRYEPLELIRISTTHEPNFAPGTSYSYCNTCYVLAGLVIEKVTGRSLATELRDRIFVPLKLRGTTFDTEPQIAGRHSQGYIREGKQLIDVSFLTPSWAWAAGAIVSTVNDLERFYSALNRGRLLSPELMRVMRTTAFSSGYGLGLAAQKLPCGTVWGNGGNFVGYNAQAYGSSNGRRQYVQFLNLDESAFTPRLQKALAQLGLAALC